MWPCFEIVSKLGNFAKGSAHKMGYFVEPWLQHTRFSLCYIRCCCYCILFETRDEWLKKQGENNIHQIIFFFKKINNLNWQFYREKHSFQNVCCRAAFILIYTRIHISFGISQSKPRLNQSIQSFSFCTVYFFAIASILENTFFKTATFLLFRTRKLAVLYCIVYTVV